MDRQKNVTIKDVAKLADVSITTVSRVLNNRDDLVNPQTRKKVLEAINELRFRPNAMAQSLHSDATKTIGLIVQDISNPYYPSIVRNIEESAQKSGYSVILANAQRSKKKTLKILEVLWGKRVDGLIIVGGSVVRHEEEYSFIRDMGVPTVVLGKTYGPQLVSVRVDNTVAARSAAEYLVKRGHRRIGILTGPPQSSSSATREAACREVLEENGIELPEEWVLRGDYTFDTGERVIKTLYPIGGKDGVTAMFVLNDMMAIGAIKGLQSMGYNVPDDISVIGFDNIQSATYINPGLTTVGVPVDKLGRIAMDRMAQLLAGKEVQAETIIPTSIVERESVAEYKG